MTDPIEDVSYHIKVADALESKYGLAVANNYRQQHSIPAEIPTGDDDKPKQQGAPRMLVASVVCGVGFFLGIIIGTVMHATDFIALLGGFVVGVAGFALVILWPGA